MMPSSPFFIIALLLGSFSGMSSAFLACCCPVAIRQAPAFLGGTHTLRRRPPRQDQEHIPLGPPSISRYRSNNVMLHSFPKDLSLPGKEVHKEITKLIVDDELWGMAIRLGDIVRDSVWECAKRLQFRPDQIAIEIDKKIKKEIAREMGKEEFSILDFIWNLNTMAKNQVREMIGDDKDVEYIKMTDKIEKEVKTFLVQFTGKKDPDGKDVEGAIEDRARKRLGEFLGMEQRFSLENVAKEIDKKRNDFWKERLSEFWADRANDVNNMATKVITGKDTYQFGDVTAKLASNIFGSSTTPKK